MRFAAVASLLFLGAIASPVAEPALEPVHELYPRADNGKQVSAGISKIQSDTTAINSTLNTIAPNADDVPFPTLAKLLTQSQTLVTDINSTSAAAKSSDKFSYPNTFEIGIKVLQLSPVVNSTLQNFVNHKPAFDNAGVSGVVLGQLKLQRGATQELANNLTPKLQQPVGAFAPVISKQILSYFDTAIAAYSQ